METLTIEDILKFISLDRSLVVSNGAKPVSEKGSVTVLRRGRPQVWIRDISTDSRSIQSSDLFLALVGERFDGHDFLASVLEKGVQVLVVQNDRWDWFQSFLTKPVWILGVDSSLEAYQSLSRGYLYRYSPKKVAITGSNGKTSVKEMMRTILSTEWKVHANKGNFNNQVGVPKTLLETKKSDEIILVEMGAGKKGDIGTLSKMVEPDFGVITNISQAHSEFLGSLMDIAHEKRELFLGFHSSSMALLNREDLWYDFLTEHLCCEEQIRSFSMQSSNKKPINTINTMNRTKHGTVYSKKNYIPFHDPMSVSIEEDLGLDGYQLRVEGITCFFSLCGLYQVLNLHFALLLAKVLELPHKKLIEGIEAIQPNPMRMEVKKGRYILILDAYNANPESMRKGLDYFYTIKTPPPMKKQQPKPQKIALLGDMLELGDDSKSLHFDLGKYVAELDLDFLFFLGEDSESMKEGALQKGFPESRVLQSKNPEILVKNMKKILQVGDLVYCKASRGVELERVFSFLL